MSEILVTLFLIVFFFVLPVFVAASFSTPWVQRRGRGYYPHGVREANGPSPWRECKRTGKWYDRETGKEVNVVKISLAHLLDKYCECGKEKDHE